jgi:hypothetical protein
MQKTKTHSLEVFQPAASLSSQSGQLPLADEHPDAHLQAKNSDRKEKSAERALSFN